MRVFLVGPGGAGKSTTGPILAQKLNYKCTDLDTIFWSHPNHQDYIKKYGYHAYCYENSKIFFQLLETQPMDSVFILSSGFLVHEGLPDLVKQHRKALQSGISLVLLPSSNFSECSNIIVSRQLQRGFKLDAAKELQKIKSRFYKYQKLGDIKVYSSANPEVIAQTIFTKLKPYL